VIVVDASVWVRALIDSGPAGEAARRILTDDPDWLLPAHAPIEVLRTIRRHEMSGVIDSESAEAFASQVIDAEIRCTAPDEALLAEVWRYRHNLSAYDAPYVALATRHETALITFDVRLATAAKNLGAQVIIPE